MEKIILPCNEAVEVMRPHRISLENRFFGYGFNQQPLEDVRIDIQTFEIPWSCAMDTIMTLVGAPELDGNKIPDHIIDGVRKLAQDKLSRAFQGFDNPKYWEAVANYHEGNTSSLMSDCKELYGVIRSDFQPHVDVARTRLNEIRSHTTLPCAGLDSFEKIMNNMVAVLDFYSLSPSGQWTSV